MSFRWLKATKNFALEQPIGILLQASSIKHNVAWKLTAISKQMISTVLEDVNSGMTYTSIRNDFNTAIHRKTLLVAPFFMHPNLAKNVHT